MTAPGTERCTCTDAAALARLPYDPTCPVHFAPGTEGAALSELIAKYEGRAANESTRYVRAADVVADLRGLSRQEFLRGLQAARETVERQTDLTELVHFERPSDYRKGVLTCLMALEAQITAVMEGVTSDG